MVHLQVEQEARMDLPFDYNFEPEAEVKEQHQEVRTATILYAATPHIVKHGNNPSEASSSTSSIMQRLKVAYLGKVFWIERELLRCPTNMVQTEYRLMIDPTNTLKHQASVMDKQMKRR